MQEKYYLNLESTI